jgi:hypothetical protein
MHSLLRTLLPIALVLWSAHSAGAETQILRIGKLELRYDATRWRAVTTQENRATMHPIGAAERKLDPIIISRVPGEERCEPLVRKEFLTSHYEEPTSRPVEIAGMMGVRANAQTRCRNAMPRGEVICVPFRDNAYLLTALTGSCRSGAKNLFSGIDPLGELVGGIRFVP